MVCYDPSIYMDDPPSVDLVEGNVKMMTRKGTTAIWPSPCPVFWKGKGGLCFWNTEAMKNTKQADMEK